MKTTYLIYRPGLDEPEMGEIDWPREPRYDRLKALIEPILDGGKLEHVSVLHDGKRADMFVDEEFMAKGLPRNKVATAIYRNNWLTQHPGTDPESISFIAGTAVLFQRIVWL